MLGNDKTVVSVLSNVNDAGISRSIVLEYEELMSEKIHLQDSFLDRHRLNGERLCSDTEFRLFLNVVIVKIIVCGDGEGGIAQSLFESCFVFAYLTLDGFHCPVK